METKTENFCGDCKNFDKENEDTSGFAFCRENKYSVRCDYECPCFVVNVEKCTLYGTANCGACGGSELYDINFCWKCF